MFLTLLTFLPLCAALVVLAAPRELARAIGLGASLAVAALGVWLFARGFEPAQSGAQLAASAAWFRLPASGIDVRFQLGVDGLSVLMVVLTTVLMPIVLLSAQSHIGTRVKEFVAWMLVMETGMLGVFLALDLVLFYFFWETSLIPLYFIIGIWGGERRLYATVKFFLYTVAGSLVMLIAAIFLVYRLGTTDVALLTERASGLPPGEQLWLFAGFALAFAIKVPLLPLHTWLADAHTEAPTSGSVVLAGVLLKMGTYGLLRFGIALFPHAAIQAAPVFMALGALGIVYGALLAMAQSDLKRLIACSSVSHLGFVVLGLFALTHAGLQGGMLQMVNHGLSTGLLFLLVGMVYERRHTRELAQFGGLGAVMPLFAFYFVIAVLSSVGLPGLNGFVGEYLILLGSFEARPLWAVLGVSGVIFGAIYLLMATRKLLWGPIVHDENRALRDMSGREVLMVLPLVLLVFWIGISPNTFLARSDASMQVVLARLADARAQLDLARAERALDLDGEDAPR